MRHPARLFFQGYSSASAANVAPTKRPTVCISTPAAHTRALDAPARPHLRMIFSAVATSSSAVCMSNRALSAALAASSWALAAIASTTSTCTQNNKRHTRPIALSSTHEHRFPHTRKPNKNIFVPVEHFPSVPRNPCAIPPRGIWQHHCIP